MEIRDFGTSGNNQLKESTSGDSMYIYAFIELLCFSAKKISPIKLGVDYGQTFDNQYITLTQGKLKFHEYGIFEHIQLKHRLEIGPNSCMKYSAVNSQSNIKCIGEVLLTFLSALHLCQRTSRSSHSFYGH